MNRKRNTRHTSHSESERKSILEQKSRISNRVPDIDCVKIDMTNEKKRTDKHLSISVYLSSAPKYSSVDEYFCFMKKMKVKHIFCFCNFSYDHDVYSRYGLILHNLEFEDGSVPNKQLLDRFDHLIDRIFSNKSTPSIGMYCQSGLGRAPTMLAYLMITRFSGNRMQCVETIREYRKGSFNSKQLSWILDDIKDSNRNLCCIL
jgi:protein-tyrosine phosphatase